MSAIKDKHPTSANKGEKTTAVKTLGNIPFSRNGIISLAVYLISVAVLLCVFIYMLWPSCAFPAVASSATQPSTANANGNDNRNTARAAAGNVNQNLNAGGNQNSNTPGNRNSNNNNTSASGDRNQPPANPTTDRANQPKVISVSPDSGLVSGDRLVTIHGSEFKDDVKVSFGGVDAKIEAATSDSILVKTPPHEPGKVDVTVVNPDRSFNSLTAAYTYSCPPLPGSQVLLLVILAGALGGTIHALRSFFWYVGNRKLVQSWVLMYIFLPFIGGATAAVFFFIFGAGFITSPANVETPVYIVAIAAITGLFSQQAALKLQDIANAVLTKPGEGKDSEPQPSESVGGSRDNTGDGTVTPKDKPKIDPPKGKTTDNTPVTITGVNFSKVDKITFGDAEATDVVVGKTSITAKTPTSDKAGDVEVIITSPEGAPVKLTYTYE